MKPPFIRSDLYEGRFTYRGSVIYCGPRVNCGSYTVKADTIEQAESRIREQAEQTLRLVFPDGYKVKLCGIENLTVSGGKP